MLRYVPADARKEVEGIFRRAMRAAETTNAVGVFLIAMRLLDQDMDHQGIR